MPAGVQPRASLAVLRHVAVLFALLSPSLARAQFTINQRPVVDAVDAVPLTVDPGGVVTATCTGHDPDGSITSYEWSCLTDTGAACPADGGFLPTLVQAVTIAAADGGDTVMWMAPQTLGRYELRCFVRDDGPFGGSLSAYPGSVFVDVTIGYTGPSITDLTASTRELLVGETAAVSVTAFDPDDTVLTVAWVPSGGTVSGINDGDPSTIDWQAPQVAGTYTLRVTVTDPSGQSATASLSFAVLLARPDGAIDEAVIAPTRLAELGDDLAVLDVARRKLLVFTPTAQLKLAVSLPGQPLALAADANGFVVALEGVPTLLAFDRFGRRVQAFVGQSFGVVRSLQADPQTGGFFVADGGNRQLLLVPRSGGPQLSIDRCGTEPLGEVTAATRTSDGSIIAVRRASSGVDQLCAYAQDGTFVGSRLPFGLSSGSITLASDAGPFAGGGSMVLDVAQGELKVFGAAGEERGAIGRFGELAGELRRPMGVAQNRFGYLFVASPDNGRIERFALPGAQVPLSPGDADFDGLPDAWELAFGLDPTNPKDYAQDTDGDTLVAAEELELGTNPNLADTDGDGWDDGREVAAGTNPLDPSDHAPVADAGNPQRRAPSFVRLDGKGSHDPDNDPLTFLWTQQAGPEVVLKDSDTASPTFVARAVGTYVFELDVSDGASVVSATTEVRIYNVAPVADAGPAITAAVGEAVQLRGGLSSDANGDPLSASWSQEDGAPLLTEELTTPNAEVTADAPGYRRLALTVDDGSDSNESSVDVVLSTSDEHVPRAQVLVVGRARVGEEVLLVGDSSSDLDNEELDYSWELLEGSANLKSEGDGSWVSFVPEAPGRYVVSLTVLDAAGLASPPVLTELVADSSDNEAPIAHVVGPAQAWVESEVELDGTGSVDPEGAELGYLWRQVRGPRVQLEDSAAARLTFVPIDRGTYVFELVVDDGSVEGVPVRHQLLVDDAHNGVPVAIVPKTLWARKGEKVLLDGSQSFDPDDTDVLHYQWEQTAGPYVALHGAFSEVAQFNSPTSGHFVFALHVDDGGARSLPAEIEVNVGDEAIPQPAQGCGGCAGGAASPWLLLALLGLAWRRRVRVLPVLLFTFAASLAHATDAPHDGTNFLDCTNCHVGHKAAGVTLTSQQGNPNLCLSCHQVAQTHLPAFLEVDEADRFAGRGFHHRWDSGVAGYGKRTVGTNGSSGNIDSGGSGYTGSGAKTYVLTITANGDATTATFSWSASGGAGGSGSATCGSAVVLNEGITAVCNNEPSGSLGTCGAFFCTGDQWTFYVTGIPTQTTNPTLLGGNGSRMPNGKAVCSTCHDQHSQAHLSHTSRIVNGNVWRHFMRIDNDAGQLCKECHADRFPNSADPNFPLDLTRSHTGATRSHPVSVVLNQNSKGYDRAVPLDANGDSQATGDGKASNDLILTTGGQVTCLTCHAMHGRAADGNSQTD